jgi:dCTP deaminase
MILTGNEIDKQVKEGRIFIEPYNKNNINPNSYDVSVGDYLYEYTVDIIDPSKENAVRKIQIPKNGIKLTGGGFYLGFTMETIGSEHYVPIIHAKSGAARAGLFIHVTSDLVDLGYKGNLTLQLAPVVDLIMFPFSKLAQITFWKTIGEIKLYNGKYMNSKGPQPSKSYLDFNNKIKGNNK